MFTHILVATDYSEPADAALQYARTLAEQFGGSLHVVHVVEIPSAAIGPEVYIGQSSEFQARLLEEARSRLEHLVTPNDRTRYGAVTAVISGTSARSIIDYATEHDIDLIVMGTHGRRGLSHLLMGSVAEHVMRHAPCPVMTVRQPPGRDARLPDRLEREWAQAGG